MPEAAWFWVAYGGCAALLVLGAYWGGRRRRLRPREVVLGAEVLCGRCGYDVRGLPGTICPECGGDLAEVGRTTPRFRRWAKVPPVLRLVAWTLAVAAVGLLAWGVVWADFLPRREASVIWAEYPGVRITERIVHEGGPGAFRGDVPPRWAADQAESHEVSAERTTRGTPAARLAWDVRADRWRLTVDGARRLRGAGRPTPEAIDAFIGLATGAPATRPATPRLVDAAGKTPPEALRLLLVLDFESQYPQLGAEAQAAMAASSQAAMDAREAGVPFEELEFYRGALARLPAGWFAGDAADGHAVFAARNDVPTRYGGGRHRTVLAAPAALAAAPWPLAWLAGLPFVLRRRAVRTTG